MATTECLMVDTLVQISKVGHAELKATTATPEYL